MIDDNNDYITINTTNGQKQAELVSTFELRGLGEYVIYKLEGKYFGAKYKVEGDNTTLITDLNDVEKKALNEVFKQLGVE